MNEDVQRLAKMAREMAAFASEVGVMAVVVLARTEGTTVVFVPPKQDEAPPEQCEIERAEDAG